MTVPNGTDQLIRAVLDDGPTVLPDRVVENVLAEIHATRQRAVRGLSWGLPVLPRWIFAAAGLAVALTIAGAALLGGRPTTPAVLVGSPSASPPATTSPSPVAASASPSGGPPIGTVVGTIPLPASGPGASGWQIAAGTGSLWLWDGGSDQLARVDLATSTVAWDVSFGDASGIAYGSPSTVVPVGDGAWIIDVVGGVAARIDPATGAVAQHVTIPPVGPGKPYDPMGLAIDGRSLWVGDFDAGEIRRIDLASGRVTATVKVDHPTAIVSADGALWVTLKRRNAIARIDPATNAIVATISIPGDFPVGQCGMCVGDVHPVGTALWVPLNFGNGLARIDPTTNRVVMSVPLPARSYGLDEVLDVASAAGSLWALGTINDGSCISPTDYVARVDPASGRVLGTMTVGCAGGLVAAGGDLWLTPVGANDLTRIRPAP